MPKWKINGSAVVALIFSLILFMGLTFPVASEWWSTDTAPYIIVFYVIGFIIIFLTIGFCFYPRPKSSDGDLWPTNLHDGYILMTTDEPINPV